MKQAVCVCLVRDLVVEEHDACPDLIDVWQTGVLICPSILQVQRWGSAFKGSPLPHDCLGDEQRRVVVCGDMCRNSTAEGAVLSGMAAAECMRNSLRT